MSGKLDRVAYDYSPAATVVEEKQITGLMLNQPTSPSKFSARESSSQKNKAGGA